MPVVQPNVCKCCRLIRCAFSTVCMRHYFLTVLLSPLTLPVSWPQTTTRGERAPAAPSLPPTLLLEGAACISAHVDLPGASAPVLVGASRRANHSPSIGEGPFLHNILALVQFSCCPFRTVLTC